MAERTPSWGIQPVPDRLRSLGAVDVAMLWSSLGLSLLVLVAGTVLVPALSLREALLAILIGGIFGNALLGLAALLGAEARVPAMGVEPASVDRLPPEPSRRKPAGIHRPDLPSSADDATAAPAHQQRITGPPPSRRGPAPRPWRSRSSSARRCA